MTDVIRRWIAPDAGAVIAATKLHIPGARHGLVPRNALVELLTDGAPRKLTLLAAPPGSGKTTLLAEWHASDREERPFAWLSLDEADNDPVRFWQGVVSALRTVDEGVGGAALSTLRVGGVGLAEVFLPLLLNDLVARERGLVLALDDYHLVREREVHNSVGALLEHLPPSVELALATRMDPPLPLGRYRARGEMMELRGPQLRFSEEEATTLLCGALGLDLDPAAIARLQQRTEGWAAGLYLAALTLRGRGDASEFIETFAGDDRQIVDYLSAEVLGMLDEETRRFLLQTSVLERLSGGLCDALTRRSDSASVLERMERSNLFLIPLDHKRVWYRYHQLFAELLRHELWLSQRELVPQLHRRAHAWYRDEGSAADAIHHALAAGELGEARELIALHWREHFNQGRLGTVQAWLDSIRGEREDGDPRLAVAAAWLALDRGLVDDARRDIERAETALAAGGASYEVESDIAVLRAVHRFKVGDLTASRAAAGQVLDLEPEGASFPRFVAQCMLGVTCYWSGQRGEAVGALREAVRLARETGNELGEGYALGYLALTEAGAGELDQAERLVADAAAVEEEPGIAEHFTSMIPHLAAGKLAAERGRPGEAEAEMVRAIDLSERGAGALEVAGSRLELARVLQARGEGGGAARLLDEARRAVARSADVGTLAAVLRQAPRPAPRGPELRDALTARELSVVRLLASDLSRREIGEALYVSSNTVKTHIRGIYRKLGVSSREEAVDRARALGYI